MNAAYCRTRERRSSPRAAPFAVADELSVLCVQTQPLGNAVLPEVKTAKDCESVSKCPISRCEAAAYHIFGSH